MRRRAFLSRAGLVASALAPCGRHAPAEQQRFAPLSSKPGQALDQGPFDIAQDEGWQTLLFTTPSENPLRNPGLGLVAYTWEENGPSLAVRSGRESLEQYIEKLAALPFVDILYIRCNWRDVQSRPGRLDLHPVWPLTLQAAKRHGLRIAFRVQMSNPEIEPGQFALPDFLRKQIPFINIGAIRSRPGDFLEPRYDHPAFQKGFLELNRLLAAEFDSNPLVEWVDLMMYGFWGEGHTSNLPAPFPSRERAEQTFKAMTEVQLAIWRSTPLAVNTQPDISHVGNRAVLDMCLRAGAWLRSDSIIVEEPIQIDELANRPPSLAAIIEDGYFRHYDSSKLQLDASGINELENYMLHALDLRANYWALWTEADNLRHYNEKYPRGFERLRSNLGYRLRPAWIWQRKRAGSFELIVAVANRGVSGVPGRLWLHLSSPDKQFALRGSLDAGQPHGGGIREAAFRLPPGFSGCLYLSAQIELRPGVRKPVAWACEQPLNPDGTISINLRPQNDPHWRKGV